MEKVKGIVEKVSSQKITIKKGTPEEKEVDKFFLILKDDSRTFSGFGQSPWKEEEEIEIEFEVTSSGGATYYNIRNKPKTAQNSDFNEIVRVLTMPKITLVYDRTEQVKQFHPVKIGATVSFTAEQVDQIQVESMIDMLAQSVNKKIEEKVAELKGEPPPQTEAKFEQASDSVPTDFGKEKKLEGSLIEKAMED